MAAPRAKQLGVTDADYDRMLAEQDGRCAICGNPPKRGGRRFSVDHDHKTGAVRGLLCFRCNRALPTYVDALWLIKAALYLAPEDERQFAEPWQYMRDHIEWKATQ